MQTRSHEFSWPDRIVIGTLGRPGSRTFYLQVRDGKRLLSVALEKQQAALLAEKIDEILDRLLALESNPHSVPTGTAIELVDDEPLEAVEELFRTGTLGLGWDPTTAQILLEADALVEQDPTAVDEDPSLLDDVPDVPERLVVRMPVGTARAFAERARRTVAAGRPLCPLCDQPMDPDGHTCTGPED
jgi:uncharacterized repeat protein (TIGR03847 family)